MHRKDVHEQNKVPYAIAVTAGTLLTVGFCLLSLFYGKSGDEAVWHQILCYVRIPRTAGAVLCGAALAVSGLLLQEALHNPLASPSILGINNGAGLFALLASLLFPGRVYARSVMALCGALLATGLVYLIATCAGFSKTMIILSGVAVSALMSAGINGIITFFPESVADKAAFSLGGLSGVTWPVLALAGALIMPCLLGGLFLSRGIDLFALGDETAHSLGLNVKRHRCLTILAAAVLAGAAVCVGGLISFLGLIVPNLIRRVFSQDLTTAGSLMLCVLYGSALLLAADFLGRRLQKTAVSVRAACRTSDQSARRTLLHRNADSQKAWHMIRIQSFSAGYGAGAFGIEIEDLTLKRGEVTTLIGENGCGKSTFLKSLAGILPYRGHALMDGEEIADLSPKARAQRLAYLPQSLPAPRMTVRTLVSHGCFSRAGITNVLSEADLRGIETALRETDMTPLSDRLLGKLSGGERQRAYLAMILAQDPDYLLVDEGTSSMDIVHQRKTMELFGRLTQRGKSVVTVSHDLPLSFSISSHIFIMKCGKVVLSGTPEKLADQPERLREILGIALTPSRTDEALYAYELIR